MTEILSTDFMQRAILAALLVGAVAPMVGIFVVQRRMSLIGDGMGHVALAGVAIGVLTHRSPVLTALVAAVIAAVVIEILRARGRTSGDQALAIIFYGGIAAGVVIISKAPDGTPANLMKYLFGSILTVRQDDLVIFAVLAVVIAVTTWVLRPRLFAVANDEEYARAVGLPVLTLNIVLAVLTATTVVIAMRIVGLLLISALMIVPNAAAQLFARSFSSGVRWAIALGLVSAVGGVVASYPLNTPSGGTIVLVAIGLFLLISISTSVVQRVRGNRHDRAEGHDHEHGPGCGHASVPHEDHVDYVHDGHLHAPHHGHYDEHGEVAPAEQTTEEVTP
ncbi:metal ABC transporter permease [Intrasporangium calvum]|uniref:ABC-3 protein n=1 Tax=Intrasporangium calvum (strain ATCC 23552 / DSM 43043 / JCM 3097 / NBRC 12989 / NCIMB 10167 / NRRL B-3866 / 7 KIP) TaxID=710696 RepID=E6SDI1_INTC7|nr:metal ABC transporter permease [Intrasporangium calvum]ADU48633.1 ABC-3 protein [Intrasporangium calvum DSM 43043]AXG13633.1 metal ABC transporter permease [Intrasporangium calvum]